MTLIDRRAEVRATVQHRGRDVTVQAIMLGYPTKVLGEPKLVELEVTAGDEDVPVGRVTLVPIQHVKPTNEIAVARLRLEPIRT